MKALVIGFDGGDKDIFETFDMPFIHGLLNKGETIDAKEDLVSRGWSEIITGRKAPDTGSLYHRPNLDGTTTFHTKFSLADMLADTSVTPIWKLLEDRGASVGIMNVPTTRPAANVNGFIVSGGGGGLDKIDGIPEDLYYPDEVKGFLEKNNYIFDLRILSSGIKNFTELVDRMDEVIKIRAATYIQLCEHFTPDMGFLCFRVTTGLQYLARKEILEVKERRSRNEELNKIGERLARHYKLLDECVKQVYECVNPEHFILTADHGTAPYIHKVNMNSFLAREGWLHKKKTSSSAIKNILRKIKSLLPYSINVRLMGKATGLVGSFFSGFDEKATEVFGVYQIRGAYINDEERFGGPVITSDIAPLVDRICAVFNASEHAQKYSMVASPYRRNHKGSTYYDELPDICIDAPDSMFFVTSGPFISKNENYGLLSEDISNARNPYTGIKGDKPLFCVDKNTANLSKEDDIKDLTLVYRLIDRIFK